MNLKIIAVIIGIALISVMTAVIVDGQSEPTKEISYGWYARADSRANGAGISDWNMSVGETGVRCLCGGDGNEKHTGFLVKDHGTYFEVVQAPDDYSDTIGRKFLWKQPSCFNCAD